jgi:hypothetical protein
MHFLYFVLLEDGPPELDLASLQEILNKFEEVWDRVYTVISFPAW